MIRLNLLILTAAVFWVTLNPCLAPCQEGTGAVEQPAAPALSPQEKGPEYKIGPGDVLRISEWRNEDLTFPVTVLPDGYISFPLIGEIRAAGKTVSELKTEVEQKLTTYIPEPTISVMVTDVQSYLIYVIGKANRPGVYPLTSNINVLQALAMAGGLNTFAKKGDIKVFREEGGSTQIFEFDYDDVAEGENLEQNIILQRGDVIVVP